MQREGFCLVAGFLRKSALRLKAAIVIWVVLASILWSSFLSLLYLGMSGV